MDETLINAILETAQNQKAILKSLVAILDKMDKIQEGQVEVSEGIKYLTGVSPK